MKIELIETYPVKPRWQFVRVVTDTGIEGWGETTLEGNLEAVAGTVEAFSRKLVGQDPTKITQIWQTLYRSGFYRGGPVLFSAISGLDQALWDITGKNLEVPVYQLLGGAVRNKLRMYSHVHGKDAEELSQHAREMLKRGYTAMKTSIPGPVHGVEGRSYVTKVREMIGAIRETVGPEVDIAIDLHGRSSPAASVSIIQALQPLDVLFYEEPALPETFDALQRVRDFVPVPIATGERLYGKWSFFDLLSRRLADVIQPDLSHAGGISECRTIAAMAESRHATIAPHCPLGPVALAACLQLDATIPNFLIQEHVTLGDNYLINDFKLENGFVPLPDKPGLGIEVDLAFVKGNAPTGFWETPALYFEDGSMADW